MKIFAKKMTTVFTCFAMGIGILSAALAYSHEEIRGANATSSNIILTEIGTAAGSAYNTTVSTVTVVDSGTGTTGNYVLNYFEGKKQGTSSPYGIVFDGNLNGYIGNNTAISGTIDSVTITTMTGSSTSAQYDVAFGTSAFTAEGTATSGTTITAGGTHTFENTGADASYFVIYLANTKKGQVQTINIAYSSVKVLQSLAVTTAPTKVSYLEGESFDATGMAVTATYDTGAEVVTDYTYSPTGALATTDTSISISFTHNLVTKTASQAITVTARSLTSIAISTAPTKVSYAVGESLNLAGMVITLNWSAGSATTVGPFESNAEYASAGVTTNPLVDAVLAIENTGNVTVSYQSLNNTFAITVAEISSYSLASVGTTYTVLTAENFKANVSGADSLTITNISTGNLKVYANTSGATGDQLTYEHASIQLYSKVSSGTPTAPTFSLSLPSGKYATKVTINAYDSAVAGTLSVNSEASATAVSSTASDFVFRPFSNALTFTLNCEGASLIRCYIKSIVIDVASASDAALAYGTAFLAATADECTAKAVTSTTWSKVTTWYANADAAVKAVIDAATSNASGTDLENCIARYGVIVTAYGYTDFMSRGYTSNHIGQRITTNNMMIILAATTALFAAAGVAYFLLRKKKVNK